MPCYAPPTQRLDRFAIGLSGLCVVHCLGTTLMVALLASAGGVLAAPWIHETGLWLAMVLAVLALGRGLMTHGLLMPSMVGVAGLTAMGGALTYPHASAAEIGLTMAGVLTLALAHRLNGIASE